MKHPVEIFQCYRLERRIVIEIEADNPAQACDMVDVGDFGLPAYDDPRWVESRTLEHEEAGVV